MRYLIKKIVLLNLMLLLFISCKKEDKKNNVILEIINEDINNKVNTQFLNDITSLNLKIVGITQLTNDSLLDQKTKKIIADIKINHIKMNKRIKSIAKKNLIIIPDTTYEEGLININDSLAKNRNYVYLVALEKLIKEEVEEYELIKENTNNVEIEKLASNSIEELNSSLSEIDFALNNY
ncbi:hypothetical protein [Flavobacterium okayamense]|uniref:DUF4142 domain-containing protein n=1 Tax=Flavobacterium okayamense TaxID=2830782 RepID=A0ABN6I1M0_9FLAO|nr:hypothetical protein [Flavobacterium okayamense]BCY29577.1 hypothetical protein KK2020170_24450 [Flavobacterium okayamense]